MPPAARVTDMHTCPMADGPVPHVGGPILPPCAVQVLIGGLPAARVTDMLTCVGPPDMISMGSPTVLISGLPAARMTDPTVHGGVIVLGEFTVMIGESGSGSGGGGGGAGAPAASASPSAASTSSATAASSAAASSAAVAPATSATAPPSSPQATAQQMIANASAAEPGVTSQLQSLAGQNGAQLAGLEYRLKSEGSLARKLTSLSKDQSLDDAAATISDTLRYTAVLDENTYTDGANRMMSQLESQGYKKIAVKPTWQPNAPYKGLNTVFASPSGQVFELQFHTPQSFAAKQETHALYEEARLDSTPPAQKIALMKQQVEISNLIRTPKGADQIPKFRLGSGQ